MSAMADYYCPDETPDFRDPTPEEMEANAPAEERMLALVRRLRCTSEGADTHRWLNKLEAYFHQAIEDRNAPRWHDDSESYLDHDPFADD